MPELPEAETMRRVTEAQIAGRRVERVRAYDEKIIMRLNAEAFCEALSMQIVSHMARRGKLMYSVGTSLEAKVTTLRWRKAESVRPVSS